jgi:mannose-6-phosphate isomerase-like protein (cupin superfamily)
MRLTDDIIPMKIVRIGALLKRLKRINDEIRYAACFESRHFTSGLIAFRHSPMSKTQQIKHTDKDVVCHVIEGTGRLRVGRRRFQLHPGTLCHIPKNTPHDFVATKSAKLILFYSLIES